MSDEINRTAPDLGAWRMVPAPEPRAHWTVARATVGVTAGGEVTIGLNMKLAAELGLAETATCDIYEGVAGEIGWLLIHFGKTGAYKAGRLGKGARVIRGFRPEWAPEFKQKSAAVRLRRLGAKSSGIWLALDLPGWFDRELAAEIEAREAGEAGADEGAGHRAADDAAAAA
jgi:hypothetical protein